MIRDIRNVEEMTMRSITRWLWLVGGALVVLSLADVAHAQKKTLVVALFQDPDLLDPTLARTYVGRIVFSQICEKLYEIDENLRIYPQLALDMPAITDGGRVVTIKLRPGVKFNDGTAMDAESVKFSLVRHRPRLRRSLAVRGAGGAGPDRRGEVRPLLRPRTGEVRQDRLSHHSRRQRPPGESPLG